MSRNQFNDRILRGFILSSDALFEIRQLLDRRQKTKFSDGLSPEAKMALQQMREDTRIKFDGDSDDNSAGDDDDFTGRKSVKKTRKTLKKSGRDKSRRQISFTDHPRGSNTKGMKSIVQTKDVINTNELSPITTTGREGGQKHNVGDEIMLTTDPNPVDKCREWVTDNDVDTTFGT